MSKVYCGSELVWERKATEEPYREIYTSHLTRQAEAHHAYLEFARNGQKVIDVDDIVKVVVGGEVTIPRSKIHVISNTATHSLYLTSTINSALGYSGTFFVFDSVEIYLK